MKIKTIELYEYDELPEDVKAKVVEKYKDINVDWDGWHDCVMDEWKEKLEEMGFNDPEISYTGFWSQGDGASFTCKHVDILKFLTTQKMKSKFRRAIKAIDLGDIVASIDRTSHQYSHEYTISASVEYSESVGKEGESIENILTDTARRLSKEIYRSLEKEYDAMTSKEEVIETIKANEYTFTLAGEMENM